MEVKPTLLCIHPLFKNILMLFNKVLMLLQLEHYKKVNYTSTREAAQLGKKNASLQDQLARSEEELKQAEKTMTLLKAKVKKLKYRQGPQSGSFLETPERQERGGEMIFTKTPKLGALVDKMPDSNPGTSATLATTPVMRRPEQSDVIDLDEGHTSVMDASFDLFEASPRTQVRKACEENKMKVVKISSAAAATSKAVKRGREEEEEEGVVGNTLPLVTLNIMRRRDKAGRLLGSSKSVIRKDYDGLGGTSSFTQPLGRPMFAMPKKTASKFKRTKSGNLAKNPSLPTLDSFIDLT
jgi:hypothetical protein